MFAMAAPDRSEYSWTAAIFFLMYTSGESKAIAYEAQVIRCRIAGFRNLSFQR
jgi:hypothetical protein